MATFHPHLPFSTVPVVFSACSWRTSAKTHPASAFKDTFTPRCYSPDISRLMVTVSITHTVHLIPRLLLKCWICPWNRALGQPRSASWMPACPLSPAQGQLLAWDKLAQLSTGHWATASVCLFSSERSEFTVENQKMLVNRGENTASGRVRVVRVNITLTLEQICFQLLLPSSSQILFCPTQFSNVLLVFYSPVKEHLAHLP